MYNLISILRASTFFLNIKKKNENFDTSSAVFFRNIKKKKENLDTSSAGSGTGHFAKNA